MTTSPRRLAEGASQGCVPGTRREGGMTGKRLVPGVLGLLLWAGAGRAQSGDGAGPTTAVIDVVPAPPGEKPPQPAADALVLPDCSGYDWCAAERFSVQFLGGVYATAIGPGAAFDPARPVGVKRYTP